MQNQQHQPGQKVGTTRHTLRFDGQIAIVTGAGQGVGRATALRLANEGAQLVLVDRAADPCNEVKAEIENAGGVALALNLDMEHHDGAKEMVRQAIARFGRIDVSVHNVGGTIWAKPFWEYSAEEMTSEIARSLWPTLWSCREVIPVMRAQQHGAIVNVGSIATRGVHRVPYSASKGGVHAATVCMAMELGESGVRINCVSPGALDNGVRVTPRNSDNLSLQEKQWMDVVYTQSMRDTPMNRLGSAEEIAAAICFYAAPEASYITGQIMYVAGGGIG
ncbi:1,6-dihydroxycyclohexa-2,4-diene-1-carboxylate dehydrogenase [Herbaspirillum sp. RTI4]|uniref:1,6-dihydroxycyclohexa-2,4-diene-1-carboxylate dehydrogenase n=1 Tax=Herbaspirillum sp. RTI4 TaxID=3048640 RepID=UPI002AB391B0|nr:1,6-dihydroxycyclohexa-2,4-diene-1-carboxylate dehydrogenase [Herbaspirillum sp. RTI4]MDY7579923.1 1,6-dihydroxycyclohexa-2,4-diene-1-carboxylate dehydrogenase [Herbaspirillum sp. RTI4]MEA9983316.1 1,6-dihydroxycyclohexa-2,4-diene-1-carboxylate dehydrogenase [Herbaspirillum sp. RTI4]